MPVERRQAQRFLALTVMATTLKTSDGSWRRRLAELDTWATPDLWLSGDGRTAELLSECVGIALEHPPLALALLERGWRPSDRMLVEWATTVSHGFDDPAFADLAEPVGVAFDQWDRRTPGARARWLGWECPITHRTALETALATSLPDLALVRWLLDLGAPIGLDAPRWPGPPLSTTTGKRYAAALLGRSRSLTGEIDIAFAALLGSVRGLGSLTKGEAADIALVDPKEDVDRPEREACARILACDRRAHGPLLTTVRWSSTPEAALLLVERGAVWADQVPEVLLRRRCRLSPAWAAWAHAERLAQAWTPVERSVARARL